MINKDILCPVHKKIIISANLRDMEQHTLLCESCPSKGDVRMSEFYLKLEQANGTSFKERKYIHENNERLIHELDMFKSDFIKRLEKQFSNVTFLLQRPFLLKYFGTECQDNLLFFFNLSTRLSDGPPLRRLVGEIVELDLRQELDVYANSVQVILQKIKDGRLISDYDNLYKLRSEKIEEVVNNLKSDQERSLKQIEEQIKERNYEAALKLCEQALKAQKLQDSTKLKMKKGNCLAYLGNFEQAIHIYNQLRKDKRQVDKVEPLFKRADCYKKGKNYQAAIMDFDQALQLCQKEGRVEFMKTIKLNKATCFALKKDYKTAQQLLLQLQKGFKQDKQFYPLVVKSLMMLYSEAGQQENRKRYETISTGL